MGEFPHLAGREGSALARHRIAAVRRLERRAAPQQCVDVGRFGAHEVGDFRLRARRPVHSPDRLFGTVPAGGSASAQAITCACADKGGVKHLLEIDLEFLRDGVGAESISNGCSYTGAYTNGQRSGRGTYSCADGYRYEGGWQRGIQNGVGVETLAGGQKYEGTFVDGKREGRGRMTYVDGTDL